ncbi:unnamed protein product [Calypogeia fissa]
MWPLLPAWTFVGSSRGSWSSKAEASEGGRSRRRSERGRTILHLMKLWTLLITPAMKREISPCSWPVPA